MSKQPRRRLPPPQGLYDPQFEKDACGVGFVCNIKGIASHAIMKDAQHMNCCMTHRGGLGYEKNTGDGAGVLTALPHRFFAKVAREQFGVASLGPGNYGVGMVFLPHDHTLQEACKATFQKFAEQSDCQVIGWRDVPIEPVGADLGSAAISAMPHIAQVIVTTKRPIQDSQDLERTLYLIRKQASREIRDSNTIGNDELFYVASLSSRVIVYKGMLTPEQLFPFYPDLLDADYESHLAMVHSRFSTNTFPSWDRAQPNRFMSHNGEINTLLGNKNWMNARQGVASTPLFSDKLQELFPIIEPDCSDSGTFDNALEFLLMTGRTLQESVLMMIPEAWQEHRQMPQELRDFYEFNSCLMEPWDGPASIAFTDGTYIGAVLDRNGLRPSRYYITDDDRCIMASEVGVLDVPPEKVLIKGRLQPGRIFLIDFQQGRMIPDEEIKGEWSHANPWGEWIKSNQLQFADLPAPENVAGYDADTVLPRLQTFGYTVETLQFMLEPMVRELRDPLGSMGNDASLAVMSDKPRMLYDYFKQLFAQITNPAIDSIREEVVMALECFIGPEQNLLSVSPEHAHRLRLPHPILTNQELAQLKELNHQGWRTKTIDVTMPRTGASDMMRHELERIAKSAMDALNEGFKVLLLSDRETSATRVPISTLLAVGTVHHHLVENHARTRVAIVVETAEAREVNHHCLLVGYGADAINPYLAYEALWRADALGHFEDQTHVTDHVSIVAAYKKAVGKGMLKVMAKMGISTLQSYKGAQIFEAVGLAQDVVDTAFRGTVSRVDGISFDVLQEEVTKRHRIAYPDQGLPASPVLPNPGEFHWRTGGERHMWEPEVIADLQVAATQNDNNAYERFAARTDSTNTRQANLRGLLKFRRPDGQDSVPLDEVEPVADIVKRFATGAMSFGSISAEAHETLAIAMNRLGGRSNTGEGGEDSRRFTPDANGDLRRSAIKQVASGRFGVTVNYLANADELQIKIVQGAKPGEGGELPGLKVDDNIAAIRHSTPGVGLISPPASPRHLLDRRHRPVDSRSQECESKSSHQRQTGIPNGSRNSCCRSNQSTRRPFGYSW